MTTEQDRDDYASDLIDQVGWLAVVVRDEGPKAIAEALDAIADHRAALVVAAALLRVDQPVDTWWRRPDKRVTVQITGFCEDCGGPSRGRVCRPCRSIRSHAPRTCTRCGGEFTGPPQRSYCERCREEARLESWRKSKARAEARRRSRTEAA